MSTHLVRGAAMAAASVLTTLAVALPAHADSRVFADRAGDTGNAADITTVKVANGSGDGHRVAVRADVGQLRIGDYYTFWFDTVSSNPGPEYKVVVYPNSDGIGLQRLNEFGEQGTAVRCDGLRATADAFAEDVVRVSVPRSCMNYPGAVRVSLRARFLDDGHRIVDWARAERQCFSWVAL